MKQIHHYLMVIIVLSFLVACSPQEEKIEVECTDSDVPCLLIISGTDKVQAVRGTTSWNSFEADSDSPPELVIYQEGNINAELNSEIDIQFSRNPNSVEVYLWNDKEREKVIPNEEYTFVADKAGIVVYEIKAEWVEGYAYYAFKVDVD